MKKELLCIVCPAGCRLLAETDGEGALTVTGNQCRRGVDFARTELTCPTRSLTTTVRTVFDDAPVVPVRTDGEIPKDRIADAMKQLAGIVIQDRVGCGDIIVKDLLGTGVPVIATSNILQEISEDS